MPDLEPVALNDPHVSAHNNERDVINSLKNLEDEEFLSNLNSSYVSTGGVPGLHVDTDRTVNPAQRWAQFHIPITITGDLLVTLSGATPLPAGKVRVSVAPNGSSPAGQLLPSAYGVDGNEITVPTLLAGQHVLLEVYYDADEAAGEPIIDHEQYTWYDNFERTVAATTNPVNIGNAITGQAPSNVVTCTFVIDGHSLYKSIKGTVGTADGTRDQITWDMGYANGWLETRFAPDSNAANLNGLCWRVTSSNIRMQSKGDSIQRRISPNNTNVGDFGALDIVPGDALGVMMKGPLFEIYKRVGGIGDWVEVVDYTIPQSYIDTDPGFLTATTHGFSNNMTDGTSFTKHEYGLFIANRETPRRVV